MMLVWCEYSIEQNKVLVTVCTFFQEMPPGMRILMDFIEENKLRLIDWFHQFDKDRSGGISRDEFKKGLKETGLVMTQVSMCFSPYLTIGGKTKED